MTGFITTKGTSNAPVRIERGYNINDYSGVQIAEPNAPNAPYMGAWGNQLRDADILWTRSSILGTAAQDGVVSGQGGVLHADCQRWEWNFPPTGCHVRKVVSGIVVDSGGTPVSGATVSLFNTATGLLVDTTTTASDGSYRLGDPNAVTCFAVADLAGSPETAGTTIQALIGV